MLTHDPALDRPAPSSPRRGNVPALSTPLVGRADDLAGLSASLRTHRLVTLVGPAGVGKTRLATEAAARIDAPDGVWLVRLEVVRAAADLSAALADVLPGAEGTRSEVVGHLRGTDLLLVLDNCEHLAEAVAGLVSEILDAAPHVRVLATSQRPLALDGELVREVLPLPEADAVALFTQRAVERRPALALDAQTDVAHCAAPWTACHWPSSSPPRGCAS